jgi:N-acyl-D-amino-acid deacylase
MLKNWMLLGFAVVASGVAAPAAETDSEKLYAVIRAGDGDGLKALLDAGVSPNARDSKDVTPLMYAAAAGSVAEMRVLAEHGADVNAQNAFGSTALMWSVSDVQKVRLLVGHGADVNLAAKSGKTALLIALSRPSPEVARLLVAKGADRAAVDQNGVTALLAAVKGNDTATIRMLVEAGADVNQAEGQSFGPDTPLMAAAENGNLAAVKLLLAKGAKVNATSPLEPLTVNNRQAPFGGFTPLLLAATYGPPDVVKALLDAGADVNRAEARGMTALMLALTTDRLSPETVRILLDHGADAHVKSQDGETALDWARKYGVASTIEALGGKPGPLAAAPSPRELPDLRTAVERSVGLLEKTSAEFFVQGACYGCHAQSAASLAAGAARAKGIRIDEHAAGERQRQTTFTFAAAGPRLMEARGGGDTVLYTVETLARTGYPPDRMTDYLAAEIAAGQSEDGGWNNTGGLARTPLEDGGFSRTAMAIHALKVYGTPARAVETKERIARARLWLMHAAPVITEDWDMRLSGIAVAGGSEAELRKMADQILALQRPDGGWAQRKELASDAYATGMTLSALAEAGIVRPEAGNAYGKGVRFLLATQAADGSWHVGSRAAKIQPYFESGFPYGDDQWISAMGTGWAANALALALRSSGGTK